jgi:SAM-dependent methyltransferase
MRRPAEALLGFYATPLGLAAQEAVRARVAAAWGEAQALDVLALGYATPFLPPLPQARRRVAAMPAEQGAHPWPPAARNAATLTPEAALPFANALFDRVLLAHLLEEAEDPRAWLREAARVLAPSGRLMCVAASRAGAWARTEATPFGHGRPYSRTQLFLALREAGLEPQASERVLFTPPHRAFVRAAGLFEGLGRWSRSPLSGLVMVEAVKRTFAVAPRGKRARARRAPLGAPAPAPASGRAWPTPPSAS